MIRRLIIALAICLALLLGAAATVCLWVRAVINDPHEHMKSADYVTIEKGQAPSAIIGKLVSEGILENGTPVLWYLRFNGGSERFKAGEYRFDSPITPLQVIAKLEKGENRVDRITIPEGFTRFDIAKRIANVVRSRNASAQSDPPSATSIEPDEPEILALMDDTSLIKDISPTANNLEGYMYPSTYDLDPNSDPQKMIKLMVEQFRKVWKPEWTERAKAIGRSPQEIVTIASLIETETAVPAERPIVASVIYNRLSKGIPLGIDQTVVYIAKMEGRWDGTINKSDLDANSPYNTRKFPGLPPGPISSVSESSIEAALNPAQTSYIYYVRNVQLNDGSHWFYASAADFERGKAEYQKWLEKERQEKRENEPDGSNQNQ